VNISSNGNGANKALPKNWVAYLQYDNFAVRLVLLLLLDTYSQSLMLVKHCIYKL